MPSTAIQVMDLPKARWASAMSDSVPPSPLLSALSSISTYLTVTTRMSDQRISESTPCTSPSVMAPSWRMPASTASRIA